MTDKNRRSEEANTRTTGAALGGAILGASIVGLPGAIIGGIVGVFLGESVNESKRNPKPPTGNQPRGRTA